MYKKCWILFAISISFFLISHAQSFHPDWIRKANLLDGKRDRACGFCIGSKGYVCLGLDSNNLVKKDLWEYDTLSDSWTQKADFPGEARRDAISFVINNKAYVGTGINDSSTLTGITLSDMYMYDPGVNSWTPKAAYANGTNTTFRSVGLAVGGKGYVIGGRRFSPIRDNWEYDPEADIWTERTQMPMGDGRSGAVGFVIGDTLYFGTGQDDNIYNKDLWAYIPAADTWVEKASLPASERVSAVGFNWMGKGIIGLGTNGGYLGDFWSFDPFTNHWSYLNMYGGSDRRSAVSFSFGDRAYVYGGKSSGGTKKDLWMLYNRYEIVDTTVHDTTTGIQGGQQDFHWMCSNPLSAGSEWRWLNEKAQEFQIMDVSGKIIWKGVAAANSITQIPANYPGMYLIQSKELSSGKIQLVKWMVL